MDHFAFDLRAVLVGPTYSGVDSVGNALLGKELFNLGDNTTQCETKNGQLGDRNVTLVKTPGWLRGYRLWDTPEMVKAEIQLSISLCSPGPHAFILTVAINSKVKDSYVKSILGHMELFGESVWRHVILVFTNGPSNIEEYVKGEGKPLQQLIRKCGSRYCAYSDSAHFLLEQIQCMVMDNNGSHFEMEKELLQSLQDKIHLVGEKAQERLLRSQRQRHKLRNLIKGEKPELRIMMLGWVFVGKSTSRNTILNTVEVQSLETTNTSVKHSGEVEGRQVTIVETPGWWKFFPAEFTPSTVKSEIMRGISMCSPSPNVLFLMFPLNTAFTEEQRKVTVDNMNLLGESAWRHCIVVFVYGDKLGDKTIEYYIESEGEALQWLIQKCGGRYHVLNNTEKGNHSQVTELLEKLEEIIGGNINFYLNTEAEEKEVALPREENIAKNFGEAAKPITEHLAVEWNRRNWDSNFLSKGNRSLPTPPSLHGDEVVCQEYEGQEHLGTLAEAHHIRQWTELLEREWSRREYAMQLALQETFKWKDDVSEPDEHELLISRRKVSEWLKQQAHANHSSSGYGSTSTSMSMSASGDRPAIQDQN